METQGKGAGTGGPLTWTEIVYYDQLTRTYRNLYIDSMAVVSAVPQTVDGNSIRGTWEAVVDGRKYTCRAVGTIAPDRKSFTYEWTFSEDGVNWKPWLSGSARRVGRMSSK